MYINIIIRIKKNVYYCVWFLSEGVYRWRPRRVCFLFRSFSFVRTARVLEKADKRCSYYYYFHFFFSSVPVTFSYKNWRLKPLVRCHGFMRNNITSVYNNVYKTFFFFFLLNGKLTTLVIRVFTIIYSAHISFVLRGDRIRDCFVAKYKFNAIVVQIIDNI